MLTHVYARVAPRSPPCSRGKGSGAASKDDECKKYRKNYGPSFMWGQLSGWFKQTVSDPTTSLSAERRGPVSLPDLEGMYKQIKYTAKVGAPGGRAVHIRFTGKGRAPGGRAGHINHAAGGRAGQAAYVQDQLWLVVL